MVGTLGDVFVGSPGTPVQVTVHQTTPSQRIPAQTASFQVLQTNVGLVFIGLKGLDAQGTGARSGLLATLPKPASATTGPFTTYEIKIYGAPAALNMADFYVDALNAGDGV